MPQDISKEFAYRLNQAAEGHPLAPPTPFGRQSWLREKLIKEANLKVSHNSLSKWFNGMSTPRPDNIRAIAQVLSVDEVWLGSGRKPLAPASERKSDHIKARGGVLALAGMIEMFGGRVTFPDDAARDDAPDLNINFNGSSFSAIVVVPKESEDSLTVMVSEPVGDARVLAVRVRPSEGKDCSACLTVLDLTDCPRKSLGGYSVIVLDRRPNGKFAVEGQRTLLSSIPSLEELAV